MHTRLCSAFVGTLCLLWHGYLQSSCSGGCWTHFPSLYPLPNSGLVDSNLFYQADYYCIYCMYPEKVPLPPKKPRKVSHRHFSLIVIILEWLWIDLTIQFSASPWCFPSSLLFEMNEVEPRRKEFMHFPPTKGIKALLWTFKTCGKSMFKSLARFPSMYFRLSKVTFYLCKGKWLSVSADCPVRLHSSVSHPMLFFMVSPHPPPRPLQLLLNKYEALQ